MPLIEDAASSSWVWSKMLKSASSVTASSCRSRRSAVISAFVAVMSAVGATLMTELAGRQVLVVGPVPAPDR